MKSAMADKSENGDCNENLRVDAVIFGATGFTGKFVVAEYLRRASDDAFRIGRKRTLGVAGRSRKKLEALLQTLDPLVSGRWGEAVVAACIEANIDYLDITGESEFMERMEAKYHLKAVESGSIVVSACGFDSVPADLGVLYTASKFRPPSVPHSVESFLTFHSGKAGFAGHFGTWETLVLSLSNAEELRKLRASLPRRTRPDIPGPPPPRPTGSSWKPAFEAYALPFPGSDASVVRRTQQTLWERPKSLLSAPPSQDEASSSSIGDRDDLTAASSSSSSLSPSKLSRGVLDRFLPVHYGAYFTVRTKWVLFLLALIGGLFRWLSVRESGRKFLLKYPRLFSYGMFSRKGPFQEQLMTTSFSMTFVGRGYSSGAPEDKSKKPDLEITTRMTGPEMGYIGTSIILVQCALIVLDQRKDLARGGVYTPGSVFGGTNIFKGLRSRGITIDDVSVNKS